MEEFAQLC
ncbi:hypothetical protein LINPERHAP1_LOCUS31641 [Linum perenne]